MPLILTYKEKRLGTSYTYKLFDEGIVHLALTQGQKTSQIFDEFVHTITQHIRLARQND